MTRDDVLALLDRRHDAMTRRDMAAFAGLYADNARIGDCTGLLVQIGVLEAKPA
jgi:hypothetical protein